MPKKRDVASLVGNFSPVNKRRVIFVRRIRHLRGEIGEELNNRADTFMLVNSMALGGRINLLEIRKFDPF